MAIAILISCGAPAPRSVVESCRPPVQTVNFNGTADDAASARLQALCDAQTSSRASERATLSELVKADEVRRAEVLTMLHEGRLAAPRDFHLAGTLFFYSTCADHLRLALDLARHAWERGSAESWPLYVRTARRWLETQGIKAAGESDGARTWSNLDAVNQRFNKTEEGVYRVPLKLPSSLEAERESIQNAIRAAQRLARNDTPNSAHDSVPNKSQFDRAAIFDDEAAYGKALDQLAPAEHAAPARLPCAVLAERTLVALSPTLAAKRDPSAAGDENYVRLLARALEKKR